MDIIVTDLTRFTNRDIVCLAGINPNTGKCLRPMFQNQTNQSYLPFDFVKANNVIPGSCISANFQSSSKQTLPHVEDCVFNGKIIVKEPASEEAFERILEDSAHTSICKAFGSEPIDRLFQVLAPPKVSIVTLKLNNPSNQFHLSVNPFDKKKFKATITDSNQITMSNVPVTDLGFTDHISKILEEDKDLSQLNGLLQSQSSLYLRIGLSRFFDNSKGRSGFWVQLNGIYHFPNQRKDLRMYE